MKPHAFIPAYKTNFDPDCAVCEGKDRDAIHSAHREAQPTMNMFRHTSWTGTKSRNYECTNIVSCLAESAPNEHWTPTTHEELNALLRSPVDLLYIEAGVQYYGYL